MGIQEKLILAEVRKFLGIGINKPAAIAYELIPADTNIKTATQGLELLASSAANPAVGVAVTKTFKKKLGVVLDTIPLHNLMIKVSVNENVTATLTGGDTYRINVQVLKNGTAVIAKQNGAAKTTGTAIANTLVTHAIMVEVNEFDFDEGNTYEVLVEVEVTAINRGAGSITYTLNYDPNTATKELFIETDI